MDKRLKDGIRLDVLKLKTGIDGYRASTFILFALSLLCSVLFVIDNRCIIETVAFFLASMSFLLLTVFMDKLVYVLNLPTNYLFISKKAIIYQKGKKQFIFKVDEISYKFHPFYESFETVSMLEIASNDGLFHIAITKKQYKLMESFLLYSAESAG